ncbi:P-loop containing nucleoside triphosphate hydrolase protein [Xylaria nigripes]|nr:P-loop containing nucleoside triphosphate hydrolase protein [Xylaria nigripes]
MAMPERSTLSGKKSATWSRRVKKRLFKRRHKYQRDGDGSKNKTKGRWNPCDIFRRRKDIERFYSGHKYDQFCLRDREEIAKNSIRRVLESHPEDNFEITGDLMKHESVTTQVGKPESLNDLSKAVRADGQQDVDAEIPRDARARVRQRDDDEFAPKLTAAVQSIITAGPNSLGPPLEPCVKYLRMTKCGEYGSNKLTIWKSPFLPRLDNKDGRRGLLDHQVTAIVWVLSRLLGDLPKLKLSHTPESIMESPVDTKTFDDERNRIALKGPKYFGGILADSMGLGKTLTTIALVELLIRQKLNVKREDGTCRYRPILLLTPNATVANQWVKELDQVIDKRVLRRIMVSSLCVERPANQGRIIHLKPEDFKHWPTRFNYMWDLNNPRASQVVLVVSMETWASRTCSINDDGEWTSTFTDVGRGFSLVIVDEAYKVKNPRTKNWRSVFLLERQFTLLITATPCMNTISDLFGLAGLLWSAPRQYLQRKEKRWRAIERKFKEFEDLRYLDEYPPSHYFQLVAGWPALLAKLLRKPRYLRHFETLAMLRRSPSSNIYVDWQRKRHISLEGLLPIVQNYTVDISSGNAFDQEYQKVHMHILTMYLQALKRWARGKEKAKKKEAQKKAANRKAKKKVKNEEVKNEKEAKMSIMSATRLFQLASSSLDVYNLDQIISANGYSTLAESVAEMRDNGITLLDLITFLFLKHEAQPMTHAACLEVATRNSPVLRYILHYINENILVRKENEPIKKLLIIEQNLMVAFYYELVLQFLGIECRCMHANLSIDERQELVDSFNSSKNESCQILIQLYAVGFAGTNLHKSCSRVLVASQSHSMQVQWQAVHRVIRIGQCSDVSVHRLKLKNSYHTFRESRQIEKILPELSIRAQGDTKKVLVRLLNLFQYEVNDAWHSPEGRRLLKKMSLLDDETFEESHARHNKRIKLEDTDPLYCKASKIDVNVKCEGQTGEGIKKEVEVKREEKVKQEEQDDVSRDLVSRFVAWASRPSDVGTPRAPILPNRYSLNGLKRKRKEEGPNSGNRGDGWSSLSEFLVGKRAFLQLRSRDEYYKEFIRLSPSERARFSHDKNNFRRLLSYIKMNSAYPTGPWKESDLETPAVLERALELMLRVRLGAKEIAMLPFPVIDLSQTPSTQREKLQGLLAKMSATDQDLHQRPEGGKDKQDASIGFDLDQPLVLIDKELEHQARYGDVTRLSTNSQPVTIDVPNGGTKSAGVISQAGEDYIFIGDEEDEEAGEIGGFDEAW